MLEDPNEPQREKTKSHANDLQTSFTGHFSVRDPEVEDGVGVWAGVGAPATPHIVINYNILCVN